MSQHSSDIIRSIYLSENSVGSEENILFKLEVVRRWRKVSKTSSRQRKQFKTENKANHSIPYIKCFIHDKLMAGIKKREDRGGPWPFSAAILYPVQTLVPSFHRAKRHGVEVTGYISRVNLLCVRHLYQLSKVEPSVQHFGRSE